MAIYGKVMGGDEVELHIPLDKVGAVETAMDAPVELSEEPEVDVVGAVSEYVLAPFGERDNGEIECIVCQAVQSFRGQLERSRVIAGGFVGWVCTNSSCPSVVDLPE